MLQRRGRRLLSIKPPSDLLLDVARAADPATSAAAAERLAKIGAQSGAADAQFAQILNEVGPPEPSPTSAGQLMAGTHVMPRNSQPVDPSKKAYQGLEALLLQNLVETMLPQSSDLFGQGSAGTIWRSMLAQELGTDLSKKVDLGIEPSYLRDASKAAHHGKHGLETEKAVTQFGRLASKHA
jgi:peptidoglycan hydrolase FlgJ